MSKNLSNLPSQGAALRAAVERQQRELRNMNRVLITNSVARDLARMPRISVANSLFRDIARDIARPPRITIANSLFRDIGRIGLTSPKTNVAKDYRRIAEALQAPQQRVLKTQRLLVRSAAFQALEQINRVRELHQRQLKSIVQAASRSSFVPSIKEMGLTFSASAFAKDLRRITDAAQLMQAQADATRSALRASLGFSPLEHLRASFLRGLRQSLTVAAETAPVASPQDASHAPSDNETATSGPPNAIDAVSEEAHCEWRIRVFLARLPAYFEPRKKLLPKFRLH